MRREWALAHSVGRGTMQVHGERGDESEKTVVVARVCGARKVPGLLHSIQTLVHEQGGAGVRRSTQDRIHSTSDEPCRACVTVCYKLCTAQQI